MSDPIETKIYASEEHNTLLSCTTRDEDGYIQSFNGEPGHTTYYLAGDGTTQGHISTQMWYDKNRLHRADGPAYTAYEENGDIISILTLYFWYGQNLQPLIDSGQIIIAEDGSIPEDSRFTLEMMGAIEC